MDTLFWDADTVGRGKSQHANASEPSSLSTFEQAAEVIKNFPFDEQEQTGFAGVAYKHGAGFNLSAPRSADEYQTTLRAAEACIADGLSVLPLTVDGEKSPALPAFDPTNPLADSPKLYLKKIASKEKVQAWFKTKKRGVGIAAGKVSGNLTVFDFDNKASYLAFVEWIKANHPELFSLLVIVETPRPGYHVLARSPIVERSQKLAWREAPAAEGDSDAFINEKGEWRKKAVMIETRGAGAYAVAVGSDPRVHSLNRPYKFIQGTYSEITNISEQDYYRIKDYCRSQSEIAIEEEQDGERRRRDRKEGELLPGDDYDDRADIKAYLRDKGWVHTGGNARGEAWTRPGKSGGTSATLHENGSLFVFTSSTELHSGRYYTPFQLRTMLDFDGDYSACAKALAAEGYGRKVEETKSEGAKPDPDEKRFYGASENADSEEESEQSGPCFSVSTKGVYGRGMGARGADVYICSELHIVGQSRDKDNVSWGYVLEWKDENGVKHTWTLPASMLSGDGAEIRAFLMSKGVKGFFSRRAREIFPQYIQDTAPQTYVRCVPQIGWYGNSFVLPDGTIGPEEKEKVVLQSRSTQNHNWRTSGTLKEWQDKVSKFCAGNSRLVFSASMAFAAPLATPARQNPGGFHWRGGSSLGKSTATFAAGSVCGGGGKLGFGKSWRTTDNTLEAIADSHNDGLLCLDEIGQADIRKVGECAYMLAQGEGKSRLTDKITSRQNLTWNLILLSNGEVSLAQMAAQAGLKIRAGQEVRLIDLPADAGAGMGIFEDVHDSESDGKNSAAAVFAKRLEDASKQFYGTAIREFINLILPTKDEIAIDAQAYIEKIQSEWTPQTGKVSGEVFRVAARFGFIAFAGELATEKGITGWRKGEAEKRARRVFDDWMKSRVSSGASDIDRAVAQVRKFIEMHGYSRFEFGAPSMIGPLDDITEVETSTTTRTINRAGFIRKKAGSVIEYCIFPEVFTDEVCVGYGAQAVCRALIDRGAMPDPGKDGKNAQLRYAPFEGKTRRVYVVLPSIFEDEDFADLPL
jgi:uncharacterized protein (DUF927 family)